MSQELMAPSAVVPSSQQDKDKILAAIKEIDLSLTRIESERELITEIAAELKDQFGMEKRLVNSLAKTYHAGNRAEVDQAHEEFTEFCDGILSGTRSVN